MNKKNERILMFEIRYYIEGMFSVLLYMLFLLDFIRIESFECGDMC